MPALADSFLRLPLAHRGLHDRHAHRPENSRAALQAAIAAGYGAEIDVQLSADGHAMVFHDSDLDRLTPDTGPLRLRHRAELCRIPLLGGAEHIPTLEDILALVAGRIPLLIEIKDQSGLLGSSGVGPLEQAVAAALDGYDGPVAAMSFNPHAVSTFAQLAPRCPRGLVTAGFDRDHWPHLSEGLRARLRDIPDYDSCEASFVSHEASDLANPRIAALKAHGAKILCWTIRNADAERAARRIADNITFEGYLPDIPAPAAAS